MVYGARTGSAGAGYAASGAGYAHWWVRVQGTQRAVQGTQRAVQGTCLFYHHPPPPRRRRRLSWPSWGSQGPRTKSCDEGGWFGGRVHIFKFSHTKKFCGNRLSTNELRLACVPLTGPRRVYKWAESKGGRRGREEHSS